MVKGLASRELKTHSSSGSESGRKMDWKNMTYQGEKVYDLIGKIKKLYSSKEETARKKYPEVFKYFDGIIGTKISYSVHPAGIVISPIDLIRNYGVFLKDGENILSIDMEEIHEVGLAKYDFLILKNVGIIQDTYKMIGKPYPRSDEINWNDQEVWADMVKSPIGIFQMEGDYAFGLLKKYEPHSIFDMSLVTAAIRPSGASYRDRLIAKIPNHNPSELIDNLLQDNNGYLVYQEDVIMFLQEVCGLSGSAADSIRRGIARKKPEILEAAMPTILSGYCKLSDKPQDIAEKEAKEFIRIIEDASSYMFGKNHSIAYCLVGYLCAYLRHYYTGYFITSYLNNAANQEDIIAGTELAKERGIEIKPIKFRYSNASFRYDSGANAIYKGISSVKYLNAEVAQKLYYLRDNKYNSFCEVLKDVCQILDSRQLNILITLDFFSEFGESACLNEIARIYTGVFKCGTAKTINPNKIPYTIDYSASCNTLSKGNKPLANYGIISYDRLLADIESAVRASEQPSISITDMVKFQMEHLGYCDYVSGRREDQQKIIINAIYPVRRKSDDKVFGYSIVSRSIGSGKESRFTISKNLFEQTPVKELDIIEVDEFYKNQRGYWVITKYKKIS